MDSDDPLTAGIAIAAVGTGVSVLSSIRQGQVQGDTARLNARIAQREAESRALMAEREAQQAEFAALAEEQATGFDIARFQEQATAFKAGQRVAVAGSGLEATGSPLLVMEETARQLQLDAEAISHAGATRAQALRDEAGVQRFQAGELRRSGEFGLQIGRFQSRVARQAGYLGAVRSLFGGASQVAGIYASR